MRKPSVQVTIWGARGRKFTEQLFRRGLEATQEILRQATRAR